MNGFTPIHVAAYIGSESTARLMLDVYPTLAKLVDSNGFTPLHFCVISKQSDSVFSLLLENSDINARNYQGKTALHLAIEHENMIHFKVCFHGSNFDLNDNFNL